MKCRALKVSREIASIWMRRFVIGAKANIMFYSSILFITFIGTEPVCLIEIIIDSTWGHKRDSEYFSCNHDSFLCLIVCFHSFLKFFLKFRTALVSEYNNCTQSCLYCTHFLFLSQTWSKITAQFETVQHSHYNI